MSHCIRPLRYKQSSNLSIRSQDVGHSAGRILTETSGSENHVRTACPQLSLDFFDQDSNFCREAEQSCCALKRCSARVEGIYVKKLRAPQQATSRQNVIEPSGRFKWDLRFESLAGLARSRGRRHDPLNTRYAGELTKGLRCPARVAGDRP